MNRRRLSRAGVALVALCLAVLTAPSATGSVTAAAPPSDTPSEFGHGGRGDWPMWQKDPRGLRHNPDERKITPQNVSGLELKWAFAYPKAAGFPRSQPAVVGDTVYLGSPDGKLYARDAATGAAKWEFDLTTVGEGRTSVQDGPAVARGKVYFGDTRGYFYAVDQRTGKLAWSQRLDDTITAIVTSSPLVYGDRVYVGVSSGENILGKEHACCTFRGHLNALDADTGKQIWRFYTTPKPEQDGTWPNGQPKYGPSGAGVWSSPAIDPVTRTVYVGTGQNYTGSAGHYDSVLAINADTGRPRWTRRMTDVDTWRIECSLPTPEDRQYCPNFPDGTALDFDLGASPNIIRAHGRTLIGIGQKAGVFHVLDARTGKIVWQRQLSTPMPGGGLSGVQWGTSFDGERLYVSTYMANPGTLFALDPLTGHLLWQTPNPSDGCTTGGAAQFPNVCRLGHGPAVSTTPGLVWLGSMDGKLRAYSARSGEVLWAYDTIQEVQGVNGLPGRGGAVSGGGGAVVSHGMVYVQSGYFFTPYPNPNGSVFLAFGLKS
ncbi:cytochrome CBB3 [Sphaerisporangium krabiense]|uniref:Polyvinyl alcohol dehydrogenase (Cytochrome) n=1 Tax=Sphaerisporangium krabiense TaxID=763782 RepID=A0A7W8Z249_9ACTN|nr:PQQ-binding-like beta-propeller repeat protein [Sphaerisporangium krabiense]MBB5625768.1 polyvinyl alcohol dehydrogenase (cytochrome) [Sphaerisporangium krabiense]GII62896.1 cytochrome CBB3 [Sphaerisporangium krabiense]